jgi:diguanylate cyclase (GGDEF)-like protein/PAS domain S-box-containing protein
LTLARSTPPPPPTWLDRNGQGIERWLPRIILGGMLTLVLGLVIGMSTYYVYRYQQTLAEQTADIEARALVDSENALRGEINRLTRSLREQRASFDSALRAELHAHVNFVANAIASVHAALNGRLGDTQIQAAILRMLRPIRFDDGQSSHFVIDAEGRALLFPLDNAREGSPVAMLSDDTGHAFVRDFLDSTRDGRGSFVAFRWTPPGEQEAMADAEAFVRRFDLFGWTIGATEFVHSAQAELKQQALARLSDHLSFDDLQGIGEARMILVLDRDGGVLAGPEALRSAIHTPRGAGLQRWIPSLLDLSRGGGGTLQFDSPLIDGLPLARHLAYVSAPDEWGWTLVAIAPLSQIDRIIAHEREKASAVTRRDFQITAWTMFAVASLAILLSVLFYRWIDDRFGRYHEDIAARNEALSENARDLRLSAQVFEASNEALAILDHRFRVLSINPAMARISGYEQADLVGRHCSELLTAGRIDSRAWLSTATRIQRDGHWAGELTLTRPDHSDYPATVCIDAVAREDGAPSHFVVSVSDISEQKRTEQRLRHLAEYDALTGLPNRVLLLDRLSNAILAARRHDHHLAVLFVDLDRFKNINDSLGHAVGDEVLRQVAGRLGALVRASDTVSRLGGDEFVVLLGELDSPAHAASVAGKMLRSLASPFHLNGNELTVTPSIGISVFPEDGDNRDILLKNADAAMYHAKENGRNNFQFFTGELNDRARLRLELENDMRRALAQREFTLHYQPQFDLRTGRLVGAEALARWRHPERGMIPPDQFIPIAEESGLIVPLGAWILRQACSTGQIWRDEGLPDITIAVNVSAYQVRRGQLEATVQQALSETGFAPGLLELEVTETALMADQAHVSETLKAIHGLGVRLAIDDFGTGYSSLGYLKRFALDKLKIDRSFIDELPHDTEDAHLTRAIIGIGHNLDMLVIAEGVETEAQERFLTELGCDQAQGYLYARPLSAEDFRQMQIDLKYQPTSKPAASTA